MIFLCIPLVVIFWMLGGQINKLFRSIGVPLSILGVYLLWHNHSWLIGLPSLLYGFGLTVGYGNKSKLMKWLKSDGLVRLAYSFMCCIPVIVISLILKRYAYISSCILIISAFQIRMGSWGKIGKYDILPVDIFRSLSIGMAISIVLI